MKKIFIITLITSFTILSCSNVSLDDLTNTTAPTSTITYKDNIKAVIDNNCISCHKSPPINGANTSLLTYDNVKSAVQNNSLIGRIDGSIGSLMPVGGQKLPQNLIDAINAWKNNGFKKNN